MNYADGTEAKINDLLYFVENAATQTKPTYDAIGILVAEKSFLNVRPVARLTISGWVPTSDHRTKVEVEQCLKVPVPDVPGDQEEITECSLAEFKPGRTLGANVCARCKRHKNQHPWAAPVAPKELAPPPPAAADLAAEPPAPVDGATEDTAGTV